MKEFHTFDWSVDDFDILASMVTTACLFGFDENIFEKDAIQFPS